VYVAGVDIGGTFTDCAIVDEAGTVTIAKVPSTPDDFSRGFFASLASGAEALGLTIEELLAETALVAHGTTVATNVMAQRRGARVGMLSTMGHGDVLQMMRAYGRVAGLQPEALSHYSVAAKPPPLVPREMIEEIHERVDSRGDIVVELDEDHARAAIQRLVDAGAEAIGVSLLWSFRNDVHEQRLRQLVADLDGDLFVTTSSDLVPRHGEYERTMAVAVNAYVAPASRRYLQTIASRSSELGYERSVLLMECTGGVASAERAARTPVRLIGSGPAGGIVGAQFLGALMGEPNILTTDMGGTTFDVALILDHEPVRTATTIVDQCEYYVPTLDIRSIGAGGGSIAWFDAESGTIKVGPRSAGAQPGPVAYGRGGTEPTVTDADLVLGYIDPDYFLGGRLTLDKAAALDALERLGMQLGASALEVAAGVSQIADSHMADLMRKMTVEKGHDPRELTVFAFGGGGPLHGGVYARELGAARLVVPLGTTASVFSALGVASSDLLYIHERSETLGQPWHAEELDEMFRALEQRARGDAAEAGVTEDQVVVQRFADVRYRMQVHDVEVPVAAGPLTADDLLAVGRDFQARYESLFGRGTGYVAAGMEIAALRVRAVGRTMQPKIAAATDLRDRVAGAETRKASRPVYWHERGRMSDTEVIDGAALVAGHVVEGPAVIEQPQTTVIVRPGQTARVDRFLNIVIELDQGERT
jgi:N-methylhydantoinase A